MNRLVLIDGHAILYRAYHAIPTSLTTPNGQIVNAVFGFVSMLLRVVEMLRPTHLIVVFDTPEPTFRNELYKEYQSQRPKADPEFISQIDIVKRFVIEMQIPIFSCPGFEADDVIGTIIDKVKSQYLKVKTESDSVKSTSQNLNVNGIIETIIVTGDRDMLQLVNDSVKLYMPVKGLSESKLYGEKEVVERMGVKPSQIIDYKGFVGDPSDNYPGIPGVGPKSAEKLLRVWGTFENVYEHISEIDGKLASKLIEFKDLALLSKKLATIVTNAPVKFSIESCTINNFDTPQVHRLFEEYEFRSLILRLGSRKKVEKVEKVEKKVVENINQISLF